MGNREKKITYRKYFNARSQDIDGRFARDLDYLFVAQYIVQCKQVLDEGKPSQHYITASQAKNRAFLTKHVRSDKAYRVLKMSVVHHHITSIQSMNCWQ